MIGILGLGNYSTIHYIQRLNEVCNSKFGGYSTCPFKLLNVDFNSINPHLPNDFETLLPIVEKKMLELNQLGVSKIIVPNITLHETIDKIDLPEDVKNKIVHPLTLAKKISASMNVKNVVVVGTNYSMESPYIFSFFKDKFQQLLPSKEHRIQLDNLRKLVYENDGIEGYKLELKELIQNYISEDAVVIIGCTELSVIAPKSDQIIDLVEVQINKALFE